MMWVLYTVSDWLDQVVRDLACRHGHICIERSPSSGYLQYWCRVCRRDIEEVA